MNSVQKEHNPDDQVMRSSDKYERLSAQKSEYRQTNPAQTDVYTRFYHLLLECKEKQRERLKWSLPNEFLLYTPDVHSWMRSTEVSG
jgi:hypothetical protein